MTENVRRGSIVKKGVFILISALIAVSGLTAEGRCENTSMRKLSRGASNLVTWPCELFHRIKETNDMQGPVDAATYGLLKGIAMMGFRAAMGMYEVATFWIPIPEKYEPVINDPEFFFSNEKKTGVEKSAR